jgi:hypothetical protein
MKDVRSLAPSKFHLLKILLNTNMSQASFDQIVNLLLPIRQNSRRGKSCGNQSSPPGKSKWSQSWSRSALKPISFRFSQVASPCSVFTGLLLGSEDDSYRRLSNYRDGGMDLFGTRDVGHQL